MKEKHLCWHTALPFDFIQIKHAQKKKISNPVHECGSQLQALQVIYSQDQNQTDSQKSR